MICCFVLREHTCLIMHYVDLGMNMHAFTLSYPADIYRNISDFTTQHYHIFVVTVENFLVQYIFLVYFWIDTNCVNRTNDIVSRPYFNSWPTFSPYLYNRVWSELTCCNSLSHSRLACSRLSAHIRPSVNNPDTNGAANSVVVSIYNGHELS